jgi:hypothetical protein
MRSIAFYQSSVLFFHWHSSCLNCRMQRSAFASVDTLTAQIEVETGLRVRLRQQRVMRAAKFIMLMYTLRTSYTVLILTGFSLKHTAQIDLQSPCRQALFIFHTPSWFLILSLHLEQASTLPSSNSNQQTVLNLSLTTFCRDWRNYLCSSLCQPAESIVVNALLAAFYIAPVVTAGACLCD